MFATFLANFSKLRHGEVRRISLPRTKVNKAFSSKPLRGREVPTKMRCSGFAHELRREGAHYVRTQRYRKHARGARRGMGGWQVRGSPARPREGGRVG